MDAAEKAAKEERDYALKMQALKQQQAMLPLEMAKSAAGIMGAMAPKGEKGGFTSAQAARVREKALELAAPEIKALEDKYNKEASGFFSSVPKNWREGEKGRELERKKQEIINRYISMLAPELGPVMKPTNQDVQRYYQMGKQ
jgi:hypothetical protein